jgi:hypothetical protein
MKRLMPIVCGVVLLTGCGQSTAKRPAFSMEAGVGNTCTVQFRRDALGLATEVPINPATDVYNGATITLVGTLKSRDENWTVVSGLHGDETSTYVIPTHAILWLRIFDEPATTGTKGTP